MTKTKEPFLVTAGSFQDTRGLMGILEDHEIPFKIRRIFWIKQVPDDTLRGGHAHQTSDQVIVCTEGNIAVELEDLSGKTSRYSLDSNGPGLYIPCMHWGVFIFKKSAQALCLASDHFKESDYIRDYKDFEKLKNACSH
jgi:dTDP-4-dehydrorhamnose 3,5-epimerase-like enzyme